MIVSPKKLEIDLSALVHNLNQVKRLVGTATKIMGVVKSDAYGHGAAAVSRVLEREGVHSLGVAHFHEALALREEEITCPIVILCGIRTREEASATLEKDFIPVLFETAQIEVVADECARRGMRGNIYLKVDTGMGRLGVPVSNLQPLLRKLKAYKDIDLQGLMSHLSSADETPSAFTEHQIERFTEALEMARSMGFTLPLNSLANSAGVMGHAASHFDVVRTGIMLYGGYPSPEFQSVASLKPVMHYRGQVIQVKDLPDGSPVSYGRTFYTKGPRRIAVLSAGYGDGLPRSLSNTGSVLVGGTKVPIIGRVCMDMTIADVSGLKEVKAGDEAVFLGVQGEETITGDDMAAWAETIAYEVFCSLGRRNEREYRS
jgi:alanine racemase